MYDNYDVYIFCFIVSGDATEWFKQFEICSKANQQNDATKRARPNHSASDLCNKQNNKDYGYR